MEEGMGSMKSVEPSDKKRHHMVMSDSESSEDSLEQNDDKVVETGVLRNCENESEKKSRLDVFEFDEYDNIDETRSKKSDFDAGSTRHITDEKRKQFIKMRKELAGNSIKGTLKIEENDDIDEKRSKKKRDYDAGSNRHVTGEKRKQSGKMGTKELSENSIKSALKIKENDSKKRKEKERDLEPGSSKHVKVEKRKQLDKMNNSSGGKKELAAVNNEGDDDGDLPISSLKQMPDSLPDESIRSQGKNGVLKVVVRRKKLEVPKKSNVSRLDFDDTKVSKSLEITKKNKSVSFLSESKVKKVKRETDWGKPGIMEACSRSRRVMREKVQSPEKITPIKGSASTAKRGSGTEKQKLREELKSVLLDAGWKIDYRPRRSRDYLDAVYISPKGTAYWSIVKAYDAFKKHIGGDVQTEPSSLSVDVRILTRRTQRSYEREMKMKRKENNRKRKFAEEADKDSDSDEDKPSPLVKKSNSVKKAKLEKETDDRKSHILGRCTLLVRSSDKGLNSEGEGYIGYTGKRTLISWLIDCGILSLKAKVKYMNQRQSQVMLEGWITRSGIRCSCCSKVVSVSKFEIHAGSKYHEPYQNIYVESGDSLLQCLTKAWNKQEGSDNSGFHTVNIDGEDPNDDTCCLCGDGGNLMCCDGCPSTFHQSCLDIETLPPGDWYCSNCTCKFCKIGGEGSDADEDDTAGNVMLTCSLCEKKYHESCCEEAVDSSNSSRSSASFCGAKCHEIFDHLQKILGVKHKLDSGFSWSLINRSYKVTDASHQSYPQRVVNNSKLAVALSVMDECFVPIVDRRTGINLVSSVVYNCGSNFSRLNYSGFYTVILERGDEIVAAASIRVRGTQLAEMPFIGTRHMYRRQGMCCRLLSAIESVLRSVEVKKLTIPAVAEHLHTWTAVFGFKPFKASHKRGLRSLNMMVFPGVDMLQKFLLKKKTSKAGQIANSGGESIVPEGDHNLTPVTEEKFDVDACAGHDINTGGNGATLQNDNEMIDKSIVSDPSLPDSVVPIRGSIYLQPSLQNTGKDTKEVINEGEDPVSPLPPPCSDQLDVRPISPSNQLQTVSPSSPDSNGIDVGPDSDLNLVSIASPSSPACTDQLKGGPTTDTNQLDLNILDKKEGQLDDSYKVCGSLVADSKVGQGMNDDETASKIASEGPTINPLHVADSGNSGEAEDNMEHTDLHTHNGTLEDFPDSKGTGEAKDNAEHTDRPTQNGSLVDKECVPEVKIEADVEVDVIPMKVNLPSFEDGDVDDGQTDNGEVALIKPSVNYFRELPVENKTINEDEVPLSVSEACEEQTIFKLRCDSENDMAEKEPSN